MINILKADIYKILHGKGIYITFVVLLGFILLVLLTQHFFLNQLIIDDPALTIALDGLVQEINGTNVILSHLMGMLTELHLFLLAIVVITSTPIFTHGTAKNDISRGVSRTKLYMSKLILCSILCVIMYLFFVATGVLIATILNGFGTAVNGHWSNVFKTLGIQLLMLFAMTSVGVFFTFTTKKTAAVNVLHLIFFFIPSIIFQVILLLNENLQWLSNLAISNLISQMSNINTAETNQIIIALVVALSHIIIFTIGGISLFKKAEVK